jgi:hypothetical protein
MNYTGNRHYRVYTFVGLLAVAFGYVAFSFGLGPAFPF